MNRTIITLLFLVIFSNFGYSQSEKINIKTEHLKEANYLKMDDFYLTHYLYIDLFLRENLFPEASPEDVSAILKAVKKYVSLENKLDIEIEKPGDRNYLIRFVIFKKENGPELFIAFTNWSVKNKEFEKDIKLENDSYTRWYFLNSDKMTYRKDMSDKNNYFEMNKSDLANAYLFDELPNNDGEIKNTLNVILSNQDITIKDKIEANLILLKHKIFTRDTNVAKQTEYLTELFNQNKSNENLRGLKMAFDATKFQIELMK